MTLFNDLSTRKESGEILRIESLSRSELEQLRFDEEKSDSEIAELFSISKSIVAYRRRKLGVTLQSYIINKVLHKQTNEKAFKWLCDTSKLDLLAKAVTHFAFRNGPVENIHSAGKINQNDMKILNKYVVNHLAYVIRLIQNENWLELRLLIDFYKYYGTD